MKDPRTFWHGGRPGVQRGAFLLPPSITKSKHCGLYGAGNVHRTDRVYVTTEQAAALLYASGWPNGVIYQCEPIGTLEDDPDCWKPGLSFQCEKARVLRVIKPRSKDLQMARAVLLGKEGTD